MSFHSARLINLTADQGGLADEAGSTVLGYLGCGISYVPHLTQAMEPWSKGRKKGGWGSTMRRQDRTRRTHLLHTEPEQNLHFSGISDIKSSLAPQSQAGEHESEERDGIIPRGLWAPAGFILECCSKHFRSASWRMSHRLWLNIKCVQWYERSISAASVLLMETSITCPLIFHSHLGAVNPRRNRYTDTQASCVITRGQCLLSFPCCYTVQASN